MIAAPPVNRQHRGGWGLLPLERVTSNEEEALAARRVSQVASIRSIPVESIVVVGTKRDGGLE
jgi:hypothetical protein